MKKRVFLILLPPLLSCAQPAGLRLAELRARVQSDNPSVSESLRRIDAARAVLKQAQSAYLPSLSFSGRTGHADASVHPDFFVTRRVSDSLTQSVGQLRAQWLLFDGFARRARSLAARHNLEKNRSLAQETKRLLMLGATLSFRQAQLARENVEIAQQDFAFNRKLEEDARKRFEAGVLSQAEVDNFSIRALLAENAADRSRLDYQAACAVLAELMAWPTAQLPEELRPVAVEFDALESIPALERALPFALQHRPDYRALAAGLSALHQRARAAVGALSPQVVAVGELNYTENEGLATVPNFGNREAFAGVALRWDLFSGGRKWQAVREARAEEAALREKQAALQLSIRSALRRRIDEARTAQSVFRRQKKIYELTLRVREDVETAYREGAVSVTRLNEVQTDLVRARSGYSSSYIACLLVSNQLELEMGSRSDSTAERDWILQEKK